MKDANSTIQERVRGLDTLRFFAALWVLFGHAGFLPFLQAASPHGPLSWLVTNALKALFSGPAAVIVFFVISGFCIHYPNRFKERIHWPSYFLRRYLRIGIPLTAAVLLSSRLGMTYIFYKESIVWSLIAEVIYYTLYPVFLALKKLLGWNRLLLISYGLSLIVILQNPGAKNYPAYGTGLNWLLGLPCWLWGARLADELKQKSGGTALAIWSWRLGIWSLSSLCMILSFRSPAGYPWTLNLFAIAVYLWLGREIAYARQHPPKEIFEWLGSWSYSLYLTHMVALRIFNDGNILGANKPVHWAASCAAALAASYCFFLLVEKPSHFLARKAGSLGAVKRA